MSVALTMNDLLVSISAFQEKQGDFLDAVEQADSGTSFFGFNFNVSEARTVGIGNALITSLNSTYYDIVKTNLDAIYETVIDEYTTSTVKVDPNIYCPLIQLSSIYIPVDRLVGVCLNVGHQRSTLQPFLWKKF